jgi:hypothetical protein
LDIPNNARIGCKYPGTMLNSSFLKTFLGGWVNGTGHTA